MTKGNRETKMKTRMEGQMLENGPVRGKKQFVKENKNGGECIRENVSNTSELKIREDLIIDKNAVMGVLRSDRTIECVYISNGNMEGPIKVIVDIARGKRLVLKEVDRKKLDAMGNGTDHQGVIALVTPFKYCQIAGMLNNTKEKDEDPFITILDKTEDPHNLGSTIRTAELYGIRGIMIPKRRNVGITSTVYKRSIGTIEYMEIAEVANINSAIDELKESGLWIYGVDMAGEEYSYQVDFNGPCAMIIGSEERGMSKFTLKKCDKLMKVPMVGEVNSLNASVAGGIMMHEILKGGLLK